MQIKNLSSIIGLGVAIWGLSLVWPEVNGAFTTQWVTLGLMGGLGAVGLAHMLSRYPSHPPPQAPGQTRSRLSPNPGGSAQLKPNSLQGVV